MIKISPRLEFHEAIERARERAQAQRALLPDDYYGDLPVSLRSHAFTVSGLARLDQINAVADSLAEALAQGDGFAEWKKRALTDPDLAAGMQQRFEGASAGVKNTMTGAIDRIKAGLAELEKGSVIVE